MTGTISEQWIEWDRAVCAPDVPIEQRRDLRYAFYCGAMAFSSLLTDAADATHGDPAALKVELGKLTSELNDFYKELVRTAHASKPH